MIQYFQASEFGIPRMLINEVQLNILMSDKKHQLTKVLETTEIKKICIMK